jgi:hypothetical protein
VVCDAPAGFAAGGIRSAREADEDPVISDGVSLPSLSLTDWMPKLNTSCSCFATDYANDVKS